MTIPFGNYLLLKDQYSIRGLSARAKALVINSSSDD